MTKGPRRCIMMEKGVSAMKLGMWIFMLACNLLIPAVAIWYGRRFQRNPPGEPNAWFGYRTSRSMKSRDAWNFAQRKMGEVWGRWGLVMLPLAVLAQALTLLAPTAESMCMWSLAPTTAEVVLLLLSMIPVERALKENFDENGNRRYDKESLR